jgi:hypothetical protein
MPEVGRLRSGQLPYIVGSWGAGGTLPSVLSRSTHDLVPLISG